MRTALARLLEHGTLLAWLLVAPAVLFLLVFLAYPLVFGVYLAFTDTRIARPGIWVGLENYRFLLTDPTFRLIIFNTTFYTVLAVLFKLVLGLALALLLNQRFRGYRLARTIVLIPWVVPTVLAAIAWWWILDTQFSPINWVLVRLEVISHGIQFRGDEWLARASVILVNVWRGIAFFAIGYLAGLQAISSDLTDAAKVDGAGGWQVFRHILWPLLLPLTIILTTFSAIWTINDFQLIWALTRGGPGNATDLFVTLAYRRAIQGGALAEGAAIAVFVLPAILLLAGAAVWALRRRT
jgi:multiple sugar transport system permease protein